MTRTPAVAADVGGGSGDDALCLPGACVAEAAAKEENFRRWRGAAEPGRIVFRNAGGQDVAIPLSFRGLAQALDAQALDTLAKELAKAPG